MKLSLMDDDNCCSQGICKNDSNNTTTKELSTRNTKSLPEFFRHVKSMYATALGIEILCIAAAEIGENTGLYILGFNHIGIITAETIDLIFYKQAFYLSIPLALLAGAFTIVAPEAYKKMKTQVMK